MCSAVLALLILMEGLVAVYGFKLWMALWNVPQKDVSEADYLQRSGALSRSIWIMNIKMKKIMKDKISVMV